MKAWLPAVALGGALALVAMVLVFAVQPEPAPTAAERTDALAGELRCPDCQGLSVADSPTRSAQEISRQIDVLVADGATDDEVRAYFVARYGDWILLAPTSPAAWIIPFAVVIAGAGALGAWLIARRRPAHQPKRGISTEERRRVREEAEALDA